MMSIWALLLLLLVAFQSDSLVVSEDPFVTNVLLLNVIDWSRYTNIVINSSPTRNRQLFLLILYIVMVILISLFWLV